MDYCAGGSVRDIINLTCEPLDEEPIAEITLQSLQGLQYLHEKNILHLDVKSGNILLTHDAQVKIGDFGVSEQLRTEAEGRKFDTLVGRFDFSFSTMNSNMAFSPLFMAPEIIKREKATIKAGKINIFSFH